MSRRKRTFKLGETVTIRGIPVRFDKIRRGRKVTISVEAIDDPKFLPRDDGTEELTTASDRAKRIPGTQEH